MDKETIIHIERTRAFIGTWGSKSGELDRFWLPAIGYREGESGYTPEWLDDVPSELADRGVCFVTSPFTNHTEIPFYRTAHSWECIASCPWCEGEGEMSEDLIEMGADPGECLLCEGSGELYDSDVVVCLVPNVPSENELAKRLREIPETYEDGEPMDVRLCLWADGRWAVNWGAPAFDEQLAPVAPHDAFAPVCLDIEPGESAHSVFYELLEALEAHLSELQGEYDAQAA